MMVLSTATVLVTVLKTSKTDFGQTYANVKLNDGTTFWIDTAAIKKTDGGLSGSGSISDG
ncbi:hypothetical protein AC564_1862c [Lacticaseibacillus paracasei]|nr:hypothetical protein AC564_1862c [Lacticaseibacillus paracasei]